MKSRLGINITALLCSMIIFRVVLLNFNLISSAIAENNCPISAFHSVDPGTHFEYKQSTNEAQKTDIVLCEVCEEDTDENLKLKSHSFLLSHFMRSYVATNFNLKLEKIAAVNYDYTSSAAPIYIVLQVFRI